MHSIFCAYVCMYSILYRTFSQFTKETIYIMQNLPALRFENPENPISKGTCYISQQCIRIYVLYCRVRWIEKSQ